MVAVSTSKTRGKSTENIEPHLSDKTLPEVAKEDGRLTNIPWLQVSALTLVQIVDVSLLSQIRPYFPFLVQELLGLESRSDPRIAQYTGYIGATEFAAKIFSSYLWGIIADSWGRKRVLLIHCCANCLITPLIGFSSSIYMVYILYFLRGFFSATGVIFVILSEITSRENASKAFAIVGVAPYIAAFIGPIYGGQLYGKSLSIDIIENYPAAVPCTIAGITFLVVTIFFYFAVPETRNRENLSNAKYFSSEKEPLVTVQSNETEQDKSVTKPGRKSIFEELKNNKDYWTAVLLYGLNGFRLTSFGVFYSLYAMIPIEDGGYGWNGNIIGTVQGIGSTPAFAMALFVFSPAVKRFGLLNVYSVVAFPISLALFLFPLLPLAKDVTSQIAALLAILFVNSCCNSALYAASNMLVNGTVSRDILGRANGLTRSVENCVNAVVQGAGGYLFGWSLNYELNGKPGSNIPFANRNLVFYLLGTGGLLQIVIPQLMQQKYQVPIIPRYKKSEEQEIKNIQLRGDIRTRG